MYLKLFWNFFQIGLFSIGGGYAILPLIQEKIVDTLGWLSLEEFADLVAISQMSPGPIGINAATFVGVKVHGILGGVVATMGCVLPSFIIVLILAYLYFKYRNIKVMQGALKGIRPAVVALITTAGISILRLSLWNNNKVSLDTLDIEALSIFIIAFIVLRFKKTNAILVMSGSGVLGLLIWYIN